MFNVENTKFVVHEDDIMEIEDLFENMMLAVSKIMRRKVQQEIETSNQHPVVGGFKKMLMQINQESELDEIF